MQFAITQSPKRLSETPQFMSRILFTQTSERNRGIKVIHGESAWLQCSLLDRRLIPLYAVPSVRWMSSLIYLSIYYILPTGYSWLAALLARLLYVFPSSMFTEAMSFFDCLPHTSGRAWQTLVNSVPVNTGGLHLCLPVPSVRTQTDVVHVLGALEGKGKDALLLKILSYQLSSLFARLTCISSLSSLFI